MYTYQTLIFMLNIYTKLTISMAYICIIFILLHSMETIYKRNVSINTTFIAYTWKKKTVK